jgi:hypothetical protein
MNILDEHRRSQPESEADVARMRVAHIEGARARARVSAVAAAGRRRQPRVRPHVLRIWLAYELGAMRYGMFKARRPTSYES